MKVGSMERTMQKETVIYGGAFNPPTLAHIAILRACFEYAEPNDADVWVVPSGNRLDKTIPTPRQQRLLYVDAMIEDARVGTVSVAVPTLELDREVPVETVDTLDELQTLYPDRLFRFVFGADSTETMAEWNGGERLLRELPMLVVEREGSTINPLAQHVVRMTVNTPNVSSTMVRECIKTGTPFQHMVSPHVEALLRT